MLCDRLGREIVKGCVLVSVHHPYMFIVNGFKFHNRIHADIILIGHEPPMFGEVPFSVECGVPNPHVEILELVR